MGLFSTYSVEDTAKAEEALKAAEKLKLEEFDLASIHKLGEEMAKQHTIFLSDEQAAKALQADNEKNTTARNSGSTKTADGEPMLTSMTGNASDDERSKTKLVAEPAPLTPDDRQAVTPVQSGIGTRGKEDEAAAENQRTDELKAIVAKAVAAKETAPGFGGAGVSTAAEKAEEAAQLALNSQGAVPQAVITQDAQALDNAQATPATIKTFDLPRKGEEVIVALSSDGQGGTVRQVEVVPDNDPQNPNKNDKSSAVVAAVETLVVAEAIVASSGKNISKEVFALAAMDTPPGQPQLTPGLSLSA